MTSFTGYSPAALTLLTAIGGADREQFAQRRSEYDELLAQPTRNLVTDLTGPLHAQFGSGLSVVARVNGSIAPIANDARFPGVPPYKDHPLLRFWEGADKWHCPTVFLRLDAREIRFGAGRRFTGPAVAAYRSAVTGRAGDRLADIVRKARRSGGRVTGQQVRRVPPGIDPQHPHADLARRRELRLEWSEPVPDAIGSRRFVGWCARRLARTVEVHRWLLAEVG